MGGAWGDGDGTRYGSGRWAEGTKPAKVAHRLSCPTKAAKPGLFSETDDLFAKRSSLRGRTKIAKVGPPRVPAIIL